MMKNRIKEVRQNRIDSVKESVQKLSEIEQYTAVMEGEINYCFSKIIAENFRGAGCYTDDEFKAVRDLLLVNYNPVISAFLLDY